MKAWILLFYFCIFRQFRVKHRALSRALSRDIPVDRIGDEFYLHELRLTKSMRGMGFIYWLVVFCSLTFLESSFEASLAKDIKSRDSFYYTHPYQYKYLNVNLQSKIFIVKTFDVVLDIKLDIFSLDTQQILICVVRVFPKQHLCILESQI